MKRENENPRAEWNFGDSSSQNPSFYWWGNWGTELECDLPISHMARCRQKPDLEAMFLEPWFHPPTSSLSDMPLSKIKERGQKDFVFHVKPSVKMHHL